jgi:hypothetical protein
MHSPAPTGPQLQQRPSSGDSSRKKRTTGLPWSLQSSLQQKMMQQAAQLQVVTAWQ